MNTPRFIRTEETFTTDGYINADLIAEFYYDFYHNCTYVRFAGSDGYHQYDGDMTNRILGVEEKGGQMT